MTSQMKVMENQIPIDMKSYMLEHNKVLKN